MSAALAIYDALIQAKVSPDAAKAVVDALDRDMNTWLATKQDFRHFEQLLGARFDAVDARFDASEARTDLRFQNLDHKIDNLDARTDLKFKALANELRQEMKSLGSQLTIRLGVLMTGLLGAAVALQSLLR